jgi:hypothetical protein
MKFETSKQFDKLVYKISDNSIKKRLKKLLKELPRQTV